MKNLSLKVLWLWFLFLTLMSCSSPKKLSKSEQRLAQMDRQWGKVVAIDKVVYDRSQFLTYSGMGVFYTDLDYKQGDQKKKVDVVKVTPLKDATLNGISLKSNKTVYGVRRIDGRSNDYLLLPQFDSYFIPSLQSFYGRRVGDKYYKKINLVTGQEQETKVVDIYSAFEDLQKNNSHSFTIEEDNSVRFFKNGLEKNKISYVDFSPVEQGFKIQSITPVKFFQDKTAVTRFFVRHKRDQKSYYQMYDDEGNKVGLDYPEDEIRVLYHRPVLGMNAKDYYIILVKLDASKDIYWPISQNGTTDIFEKCLGLMPLKEDYSYYTYSEFKNPQSVFKWGSTAILWEGEGDSHFWSLHNLTSYSNSFYKIGYPPVGHRWLDFEPVVYFKQAKIGISNNLSKSVGFIVTGLDEKSFGVYVPLWAYENTSLVKGDFKTTVDVRKFIAENNKTTQASYDKAHAEYVKWSNSTLDKNYVPYGMKEVVDKKGKKKLVRLSMDELIKKSASGGNSSPSASASQSGSQKGKGYDGPTGALRDQNYSRLRNTNFQTNRLKSEVRRLRSRR
jgi:hypothetical protein